MTASANQLALTVILLGLAVYFSVLVARVLLGYLRFRKLWPTALITWPVRRPPHLRFLLGLGVVSLAVAVLNSTMQRPLYHVYSQAIMAAYFIVMVPLAARIQLGLYRDGVWADTGFLPYRNIGRMAFVEEPEIVLMLVPRGGSGACRLPVPAAEYGAVRKLLEEKVRARELRVEDAILGL